MPFHLRNIKPFRIEKCSELSASKGRRKGNIQQGVSQKINCFNEYIDKTTVKVFQ